MEKKTLKEVSSSLRSIYQKAQDAQNKSNPDYAIELYKTVLAKEPCFIEAREKLRIVHAWIFGQRPAKSATELSSLPFTISPPRGFPTYIRHFLRHVQRSRFTGSTVRASHTHNLPTVEP